ncbi:cation:proton antiporter domain-containing protein [Streptomyces kronopolitis]
MTEFDVAVLFADLSLILLMARVAGRVAHRLGQPAVIGEIVGGVLLGPTLFHGALAHLLFPVEVRPYLSALADLGLVLFMFVVGLEVDFGRLRGCGRIAAGTVLGSAAVPLALGALLALHLLGERHPASRAGFILFIAVAVSVTAFPVLARILTDRSMNGSWLGTIALTSAAACDLFAWAALAVVQVLTGSGGRTHWMVLLVVPYGLLLFTRGRPLLARALSSGRPGGPAPAGGLAVVLTGLLVSAAVTQVLGLHFVLGAFLFGLVVPREAAGLKSVLLPRVQFTTTLLLPVYFIVAGLNADLSRIGMSGLADLGLILAVAVTGKFAGTWLGARSQGLDARRSAVLATLMNTRGLTELIALSVGLQIGLLDRGLYSEMVVMAVVTTVMTGPLLRCFARPDDRLPMKQEHDQGQEQERHQEHEHEQEQRYERGPTGLEGGARWCCRGRH